VYLKGDCVLHCYNRGVDGKHHHNPFPSYGGSHMDKVFELMSIHFLDLTPTKPYQKVNYFATLSRFINKNLSRIANFLRLHDG
jgi:hypothetical protein